MIRPLYKTPPVPPKSKSLSVAILDQRAEKLLPRIGKGSAEREKNRTLPQEQIRLIAKQQLLTYRIPQNYGGAGGSIRDVIHFVIQLASVDSNIAQTLRPSFSFIEGLLASDDEKERRRWFSSYLAGEVFGNAGWEIGGANGEVKARIVKKGNHYEVNGSKYYSTGALYSDWISAVALNEEKKPVSFIVPRNRKGLVLLDDFDAMGQRLTASGTTHLENLIVYPDEFRRRKVEEGKRGATTPFLQLYLGAVVAGVAKNVLSDAVTFTQKYARPIKHSTAAKSVDDPYVQHTVGEISSRAFAAESVILRAAETLDHYWNEGKEYAHLTEASIAVAQAQWITAELTLKAAELLFDVGGASTTSRKHNLDRHWRNARTVINHNPRDWKAAVVGKYRLSGIEPPTSGLF